MTSRRAQTTIDFLMGISVFLLTVAFVFGFLPGVFKPFSTPSGPNAMVADRSAARLAEGLLGPATTPAALNTSQTTDFFAAYAGDPVGLDRALGVDPGTQVNVTIQDGGTIRAVNGTQLRAGPSPPSASTDVIVAWRIVRLDGTNSRLYVRVW